MYDAVEHRRAKETKEKGQSSVNIFKKSVIFTVLGTALIRQHYIFKLIQEREYICNKIQIYNNKLTRAWVGTEASAWWGSGHGWQKSKDFFT